MKYFRHFFKDIQFKLITQPNIIFIAFSIVGNKPRGCFLDNFDEWKDLPRNMKNELNVATVSVFVVNTVFAWIICLSLKQDRQ